MGDDEIVKEFLVESHENLDRLDRNLVELEKHPSDPALLADIFRTIHTIKGTSGFLAFHKLEAVAHVGENLLARLRDGQFSLNPEITSALLAMVDAVRQMLGQIEIHGKEGEADHSQLIARLTQLVQSRKEAGPVSEKGGPADKFHSSAQGSAPAAHAHDASDSTIRVDVSLLDQLMNLVGELVLARNQILQFTNTTEEAGLAATSQRLDLITSELQEGVMRTRMQPIGNIWSKFPRVVRDLALDCGKQVRIEVEGEETELDKTLIEAVRDPLTHLVRNAIDHGIETPETRRAAGKDVVGRLSLRAFHEGGQVNIEISDDGAGLHLEKIRAQAVQKGLIAADQAARMSEREVANLIFVPGFSTAERVTNVSGRGVGMDVVKTHIEKIGGTVDVQSKAGQGVMVRIKIPLTLAIIPALIVTSAGERYAIPQVSLLELVRLEGDEGRQGIERIHGVPVYRLRGRLLPLVDLNRELGHAHAGILERQNVNVVVLQADDRQFGLVVDEINDTEEIVVKPLSKQLKSVNVYAGATIMGDGKVALILDVLGLAQRARVVSEARARAVAETGDKELHGAGSRKQHDAVLLFQRGETGRMAIALSLVARLEEFPAKAVEMAGGREVVQYRGHILPLVRVSEVVAGKRRPTAPEGEPQSLQVVVCADDRRSVGLVVDGILDIVDEPFSLERESGRKGILGSAVIQERVTDIVDVTGLIAAAGVGPSSAGLPA